MVAPGFGGWICGRRGYVFAQEVGRLRIANNSAAQVESLPYERTKVISKAEMAGAETAGGQDVLDSLVRDGQEEC